MKWGIVFLLGFVCSGCTRELFEKITFYGYINDISDFKPIPDAKVIINTCCGGLASDNCSSCLIGTAFTNADGYYEVTLKASRNKRYFFSIEAETFSSLTMDPRRTQFEKTHAGSDKNFRNDFTVGFIKYWHKVHVKNIRPLYASDKMTIFKPSRAGLAFDTLVFRGQFVDATVVLQLQFSRCCTDDAFGEFSSYNYQVERNGNFEFYTVTELIKPRDTTFYEILY